MTLVIGVPSAVSQSLGRGMGHQEESESVSFVTVGRECTADTRATSARDGFSRMVQRVRMAAFLGGTVNAFASRCLATVLVALCVFSVGTLRLPVPHLAYAAKVRARHHRRVDACVCTDATAGDDGVVQESWSELAGHEPTVVAARLNVPPTVTRNNCPTFRAPIRLPRPSRHACRRASSGDDQPA